MKKNAKGNEEKGLKKFLAGAWSNITVAAALLICGLALVIWPDIAQRYLMVAVGAALVVFALIREIIYLKQTPEQKKKSNDFAIGLCLLALGILVMIEREAFNALTSYAIGLLLIFFSAFELQDTLRMKAEKAEKWYLLLIGVVISLAFGLIIILAETSAVVIGIALLLEAVLCVLGLTLTRTLKGKSFADSLQVPVSAAPQAQPVNAIPQVQPEFVPVAAPEAENDPTQGA